MHWSERSNGCKNMVKIYASSKEQTMLIVKHPATTQPRNHKEEKTNKPDPLRKTTQHYSQPTNQRAAACQRFWRSNSPHFLTHTPSSSSNSKAHAHAHATTRDNKEIWRTTKKKKRRTKKNKKNELLSYSSLPISFLPLYLCLCLSVPLLPSLFLPTSSSSLSLISYKSIQTTSTAPFHTHKQLYSSFTLLGNGEGK